MFLLAHGLGGSILGCNGYILLELWQDRTPWGEGYKGRMEQLIL